MGWPGCKKCTNWPSVGHTGLCEVCVKNPQFVEEVANQMFENSHQAHLYDLESTCLLAFLENKPNGQLIKQVLNKLELNNELKIREAIELVRKEYWSNSYKTFKV